MWPREHGTWAMLLAPFVTGVGVGGRVTIDHAVLLLSVVGLFVAHTPLTVWWRRREPRALAFAVIFGAVGALAGAVLAWRVGVAVLVVYAGVGVAALAASLVLVTRRLEHALPGQLLAAIALPVTAAVAWTVGTGALDRRAAALWLLNAAFFTGAVLYVRLKILARGRSVRLDTFAAKLRFARGTLIADIVVLAAAFVAVEIGAFSPLALLAFATVAAQAIAGTITLDRPAPLKRVGVVAVVHALVFVGLLIRFA